MIVKDSEVDNVWVPVCECDVENQVWTPDCYQESGTPICPECGADMHYSHTEVNLEKKPFSLGDLVIVTNDEGHKYQAYVSNLNEEDYNNGSIGVTQEDDYYNVPICQVKFDV